MNAHHAGSSALYWAGIFVAAGASIVHCTLAYLFSPIFSAIFDITVNHVAAVVAVIMIFVAIMAIYVKFASKEQSREPKNNKLGLYMGVGIISASMTIFMLFLIPLIGSIYSNSLLFNPSIQLNAFIIFEILLLATLPFVILVLVPLMIFYTKFMKIERHHEPMKVDDARAIILVVFLSSIAFSVIFVPVITIFVILVFIIIVALFKKNALKWSNPPSKEHDLVKQVMGIMFMLTTTMTMFYFSTPWLPIDAIPIAVLGMILYWFAMNKQRVQQKRAIAGILLIISMAMALVPVVIDREFFRSGKTGVSIVRNVPGNASAEIIQTIEGFNASKNLNWSSIGLPGHIHPESFFHSYFSGDDLATYASYLAKINSHPVDPIIYQPIPYGSLDYILNGTYLSGNLSTIYSNASLMLCENGAIVLNSSLAEPGYEIPYYYMNSSVFSKPSVHVAMVNRTSGYLVSLNVDYTSYCGSLCGEYLIYNEWYFLDTPTDIAWIVAFSETAIS